MIRARMSSGSFVMGLDAENVRRLKGGEPIVIDLTLMGGTDRVYLMFGESLTDVLRELEEVTGQELTPSFIKQEPTK